MTRKQKLLLLTVILLAIFFRFYNIVQMPGGLFPDEAANGLDINLMQAGHLQPFYERGNGREALFFYLEWGSVALFGKGPWQHHIVSAAIGVLAVVMCFLVTKRLFTLDVDPTDESKKRRAINIALLASFFMAVSSWHVVLSRTAFRATMIPLFAALTFYFLLAAYQASSSSSPSPLMGEGRGEGEKERSNYKKYLYAFLTGAAFAGGFYTYIAFRIMAPILLILIFWPWLANGFATQAKKYWKTALLCIVGFAIVIFPLAEYFYRHPGSFVGRAGQVSIFNPNLYTVNGAQLTGKPPLSDVVFVGLEVLKRQLLAFFTQGDLNWRQNISGYPFLSPLISPFFGAALVLATLMAAAYIFQPRKRKAWWKFTLLAGWFWGLMLPVVTTAEGIPHGLRGIGTIPAIFILAAWMLYEFAALIYKYHQKLWCHPHLEIVETNLSAFSSYQQYRPLPLRMKLVNYALKGLVVVFFLALISQTYILYFIYAYNSPENFYYFRSDLTPVSQYLVQRCKKDSTYLVLDGFSVQTTDYLTSDPKGNFNSPCNVPYQQVDPENSWQLSGLKSGDEIVFTQSSIFDTKKFKQYHPEARLSVEMRNKFGQAVMAVYKVE